MANLGDTGYSSSCTRGATKVTLAFAMGLGRSVMGLRGDSTLSGWINTLGAVVSSSTCRVWMACFKSRARISTVGSSRCAPPCSSVLEVKLSIVSEVMVT